MFKIRKYMQDDSGNAPKQIDLQKIFTPANDAEEILPKNSRKFVLMKTIIK